METDNGSSGLSIPETKLINQVERMGLGERIIFLILQYSIR